MIIAIGYNVRVLLPLETYAARWLLRRSRLELTKRKKNLEKKNKILKTEVGCCGIHTKFASRLLHVPEA